jgi:hypothetical protein
MPLWKWQAEHCLHEVRSRSSCDNWTSYMAHRNQCGSSAKSGIYFLNFESIIINFTLQGNLLVITSAYYTSQNTMLHDLIKKMHCLSISNFHLLAKKVNDILQEQIEN